MRPTIIGRTFWRGGVRFGGLFIVLLATGVAARAAEDECDRYTKEAARIAVTIPFAAPLADAKAFFSLSPPALVEDDRFDDGSHRDHPISPEVYEVKAGGLRAVFCSFEVKKDNDWILQIGRSRVRVPRARIRSHTLPLRADRGRRLAMDGTADTPLTIDWVAAVDPRIEIGEGPKVVSLHLAFSGPASVRPGPVTLRLEGIGSRCHGLPPQIPDSARDATHLRLYATVNTGTRRLRDAVYYGRVRCGPPSAIVFTLDAEDTQSAERELNVIIESPVQFEDGDKKALPEVLYDSTWLSSQDEYVTALIDMPNWNVVPGSLRLRRQN